MFLEYQDPQNASYNYPNTHVISTELLDTVKTSTYQIFNKDTKA